MCRGPVFAQVRDHSDLACLQIWKSILGWATLESMPDVPSQGLVYLIQNVRMPTQPPLHGIIIIFLHSLPNVSLVSYLQCIQMHLPFSSDLTQLFASIHPGDVWEQRNRALTSESTSLAGTDGKVTQHLPRWWLWKLLFSCLPKSECIPFSTFSLPGRVCFLFCIGAVFSDTETNPFALGSTHSPSRASPPAQSRSCLYWAKGRYLPAHVAVDGKHLLKVSLVYLLEIQMFLPPNKWISALSLYQDKSTNGR